MHKKMGILLHVIASLPQAGVAISTDEIASSSAIGGFLAMTRGFSRVLETDYYEASLRCLVDTSRAT